MFILPIKTNTDTDFDKFFEGLVPIIAQSHSMAELSIRLTHISQSLVSMTKKCLIISRKEWLLKIPNQVQRGDLVSVRTCNV